MKPPASVAFGAATAVAGVYELVAVATEAVPTISDLLWATPVPVRAAVIGVALVAGIDHLITRRFL